MIFQCDSCKTVLLKIRVFLTEILRLRRVKHVRTNSENYGLNRCLQNKWKINGILSQIGSQSVTESIQKTRSWAYNFVSGFRYVFEACFGLKSNRCQNRSEKAPKSSPKSWKIDARARVTFWVDSGLILGRFGVDLGSMFVSILLEFWIDFW